MASPHVAGAFGLLFAIDSDLTPSILTSYLENGHLTTDVGEAGKDDEYGYGLLNLSKAVSYVSENGSANYTYAYFENSFINMGYSVTSKSIELLKSGTGDLSITNIESELSDGFSYTSSVDENGFGTYTFELDRSNYADGSYQNIYYFTLSNGNTIPLYIGFSKGEERTRPYIGEIYIALLNDSDETVANGWLTLDGTLSFYVTNGVDPGNYYWILGTDINDDGYIGQYGELYGRFPEKSENQSYISVSTEDLEDNIIPMEIQTIPKSTLGSKLNSDLLMLINQSIKDTEGNDDIENIALLD